MEALALKAFTKRALLQPARGNPLKRPRGVLLLSPPGCGKSQFCKALGREVDRPVLILDVGRLMGSLVGQSEERTRQALRIIDAMAPCVLMVDEVEKAFAGGGSSGQGDSGVLARMFGTFLSWLNDHQSDVFVVCTANDVSRLPPEFSRAERFDAVFFLDLPGREERDAIWGLYRQLFEIDESQRLPEDEQAPKFGPVAGWRHSSTCRSPRRRSTSCRSPSPRRRRSSVSVHGPAAAA